MTKPYKDERCSQCGKYAEQDHQVATGSSEGMVEAHAERICAECYAKMCRASDIDCDLGELSKIHKREEEMREFLAMPFPEDDVGGVKRQELETN